MLNTYRWFHRILYGYIKGLIVQSSFTYSELWKSRVILLYATNYILYILISQECIELGYFSCYKYIIILRHNKWYIFYKKFTSTHISIFSFFSHSSFLRMRINCIWKIIKRSKFQRIFILISDCSLQLLL